MLIIVWFQQVLESAMQLKLPVFQEDYRKVQTEYKGETNFFTSQMIKNCMKKVNF